MLLPSPFRHVQQYVTPWTVTHQFPLSMGILQARILEWGILSFFQGIFPTQESNWVLHYRSAFWTTGDLKYYICSRCIAKQFSIFTDYTPLKAIMRQWRGFSLLYGIYLLLVCFIHMACICQSHIPHFHPLYPFPFTTINFILCVCLCFAYSFICILF